ncbi:MAG: hypothetical protein O2954_15220 [bacterium]|nr:hypothetical protein [bacterium]
MSDSEVRDGIFRIFSITLLMILVGACVVLVLAFLMKLQVLVVAFSGVMTMALASYLFLRLWPREVEPPSRVDETVAKALEEPKPRPMSPEEYRRQRALAQKLIRDKAAPALAKAIRGMLRQDDAKRRKR